MRALGLVAVLTLVAACGVSSTRKTVAVGPTNATTTASTRPTTTIAHTPVTVGAPTSSTSTVIATSMPTTTATGAVTATGASGGLTVTLSENPSQGPAGTPVTFTLEASENHAPGALHYQVAYGDGASDANVTPTYCTAGPGQPASQTWSLTHRYAAPGTYTVTATVGVICSPDRVTATITISR